MSGFFNLDAPIWAFMNEVADVIILALLWWICCCGIITIGASTTAVYYVLGKKVRKEQTYVMADFFKSFKQNFKQSIPLTIIFVICGISCTLYGVFIVDGILHPERMGMLKFAIPFGLVICFEFINYGTYIWTVLSRFDMKNKVLYRTCFIMTHKHLLTTLINTAIFVGAVFAVLQFPFLIVFAPGIIMLAQSHLMQHLFSHYITPDDEQEKEVVGLES